MLARPPYLQAVLLRLRNRQLAAAWDAWQDYTAGAQRRQQLASRAASFFGGTVLSRAFYTWREGAAEQRAETRASSAHECTVLAKVGWLEHVVGERQCTCSTTEAPTHLDGCRVPVPFLLLQVFGWWRAAAQRSTQLRVKARMVALQWRSRSMAAAFRTWAGFASYRLALRRKAAALVAGAAAGILRRAYLSWAGFVQQRREVKRMVRIGRVVRKPCTGVQPHVGGCCMTLSDLQTAAPPALPLAHVLLPSTYAPLGLVFKH